MADADLTLIGVGLDTAPLAQGVQQAMAGLRQLTDQSAATQRTFQNLDRDTRQVAQAQTTHAVSIKQAEQALQQFTTRAAGAGQDARALQAAVAQGERAFQSLAVVMRDSGQVVDKFGNSSGQAVDALRTLGTELASTREQLSTLGQTGQQTTSSLEGVGGALRSGLGALGLTASVAGLIAFGKAASETAISMDRLRTAATAFAGSQAGGQEALKTGAALAKDLGLSVIETQKHLLEFQAAAQNTPLAGKAAQDFFTSLAIAVKGSGGGIQELTRATDVFSRGLVRGKIESDELARVLTKDIPGGFDALAKGMGVSTTVLAQFLKDAEIATKDILPALGDALRAKFGTAATEAGTNAESAFTRAKNAWTAFKDAVGQGLNYSLMGLMDPFSTSLRPQPGTPSPYRSLITPLAQTQQVDPRLIEAIVGVESGNNPRNISPRGAMGLMQLMPSTAERYRVPVGQEFDPQQNLRAGIQYVHDLLIQFGGDLRLVLAAYNAGERAVQQYGGIPPFRETQQYVSRVQSAYQALGGTSMTFQPVPTGGLAATQPTPPTPLATLRDREIQTVLDTMRAKIVEIEQSAAIMPKDFDAADEKLKAMRTALEAIGKILGTQTAAGPLRGAMATQVQALQTQVDNLIGVEPEVRKALEAIDKRVTKALHDEQEEYDATVKKLNDLRNSLLLTTEARKEDTAATLAAKYPQDAYIQGLAAEVTAAAETKAQFEDIARGYHEQEEAVKRLQQVLESFQPRTQRAEDVASALQAKYPGNQDVVQLGVQIRSAAALQRFQEQADADMKKFQHATEVAADYFLSTIDKAMQGGKLSVKDFVDSAIQDLLRLAQQQILKPWLSGAFGSIWQSIFGVSGADTAATGSAAPAATTAAADFSALEFTPILAEQSGGPVQANTPYLVGEAGPELFVPQQSGTIVPQGGWVPSGQSMPAVTFNIYAQDTRDILRSRGEIQNKLVRVVQQSQRNV